MDLKEKTPSLTSRPEEKRNINWYTSNYDKTI